jgi:predicted nuclease of predicted toxin-antitoxin system
MRFLADMNLSPLTVAALNEFGWETVRSSSLMAPDASDFDILRYARENEYVIITQDLDFSPLLMLSGFNRPSLITLRLSLPDPETVTARLLAVLPFLTDALETGSAITIDERHARVRKLTGR